MALDPTYLGQSEGMGNVPMRNRAYSQGEAQPVKPAEPLHSPVGPGVTGTEWEVADLVANTAFKGGVDHIV